MNLFKRLKAGIFLIIFFMFLSVGFSFAARNKDRTEAIIQYNLASFTYRGGNIDLAISEYREFVHAFPEDIKAGQAQFMIGECFFQQEKYPLAAREFKKTIDKYSRDKNTCLNARYRLGECNFNMGKHLTALDYFNKVARGKNKSLRAEAIYGRALCYLAMEENYKSKDDLLELIQFYPGYRKEAKIIIPISLILLQDNQVKAAMDYLRENEEDVACIYYNGIVHQKAKETMNALGFFKKVVEKAPDSKWAEKAVYSSGECLYQIRQYALAYKSFEKTFKDFVDSDLRVHALFYMACCKLQMESFNEASLKFTRLIEGFPDDSLVPISKYFLGELALQKRDFAAALTNYSQVLKEPEICMDAAFKIIWCYMLEGQYGEVITRSENYLREYQWGKLVAKVKLVKGIAYQKTDKFLEANQTYQEVIDYFPETIFSEMATYLLATSYYQSKEYAQIVTHVYQILKNSPTSPSKWQAEAYFWVAEAYFELKQYNRAGVVYDLVVKNYPYHQLVPEAQHAIAACYAKEGKYEEAKRAQQKAGELAAELKKRDVSARASLETANILFNQREYEKAITYYDTFVSKYPDNVNVSQAFYQQGVALYRLEFYEEAVGKWKKIAGRYPESEFAPKALFQIGKTYFGMWKYKEAIQAYQILVDAYTSSDLVKESFLQLGQCYYNAGNINEAVTLYKNFMNLFPQDEKIPYVLEQLQTCYYRQGKKGKELGKLLKEFPKSKFAVDSYWEMGAEAFNKKKYTIAKEYFNKIIIDFPETETAKKAMFYLCEISFLEEKYEIAIKSYENFIQNFSEDDLSLQVRFRLAVSAFKGKNYLQAATYFMNFLEKYPLDPLAKDARLNIPLCYKKSRRFNEAIEGYKSFIQHYPEDASVGFCYLQVGALNEELRNFKQAIEFYQKIPEQLKEKSEAIFYTGRCYEELQLAEKVKETYKQFLKFRPAADKFRLAGLATLGEIYEKGGNNKAAIIVYQDIVRNSPDAGWKSTAREKINLLKGGKK
ncbi:tetratricopeptide repeat protein [bacterium]|nr:tetratricopeptide repeat protein [bacterium]